MTSAMREFSNFIDEFELVDLPRGGGRMVEVWLHLVVEGRVARSRLDWTVSYSLVTGKILYFG